MNATEIFEKHWTKATGKPLDEMTKHHMKYAIDAINEAMELYAQQGRESDYNTEKILEAIRTHKIGKCSHFGLLVPGGVQIIKCAVCEEYLSGLG